MSLAGAIGTAGRRGYFHETALYGSDDEFLAVVVPFISGGVQAGEPTMAAFGERKANLVRAAMADTAGVSFMAAATQYTRPAAAIQRYRRLLGAHTAAGAKQIRIVGEVPHPGVGAPWEGWARYEAAANQAFEGFPLWGLCAYDTRVTPDAVLADVERTHPHIATPDGRHLPNARFEDPSIVLTRRAPATDVLELSPPLTGLVNPSPAAARHAVLAASRSTTLRAGEVDDMVSAASEAVTNGLCYGKPPVEFHLWADTDRIVVTVTDQGHGPSDPLTGLLPVDSAHSAGLGLWIAHNTCTYVALDRADHGFTIRLIMGPPVLVT